MPAAKGTRLEQRANGFWYILSTGNSRGVSTDTRDRGEAEIKLAEFIAARAARPDARGTLTVAQALRDYEEEHVKKKCASPKDEAIRLGHMLAHFGAMAVPDIVQTCEACARAEREKRTPDICTKGSPCVDAFCRKRSAGAIGRPANSASQRRELGLLRAAIRHHLRRPVRERRISRDQEPYFALPQSSPPRDLWLERFDLDVLLRACFPGADGTWHDAVAAIRPGQPLPRGFRFIIAAYETASRPQAIQDLTWFTIKRAEGWIDLNPPGRQQTRKRRPKVAIGDLLRPVLDRAYETKAGEYYLDHPGSIRKTFATAAKRAMTALTSRAATAAARGDLQAVEQLSAAAARIGKATPYTLRHTKATHMAQGGATMRQIAEILGDRLETVEKHYIHHSPDYQRTAINAGRLGVAR
jgi:integrase